MVTHEKEVAARARRVIVMKDGKIEKEECSRPLCEPSANTSASAGEAIGQGDWIREKAKRVLRNLGKAALLSIVTHPMRSFLTAIGVFIGVASVIWLLAIGEGIAAEAEGEIMALGANNLILSSKRPSDEALHQREILLFVRAYEK